MDKLTVITPSATIINIDQLVKNRFNDKSIQSSVSPSEIIMEYVGRICYNSHKSMTDNSVQKFLSSAANKGHKTIFEFSNFQYMIPLQNFNFTPSKYVTLDHYNSNTSIVCMKGSLRGYIEILESYLIDPTQSLEIFIGIYASLFQQWGYILESWPSANSLKALFNQFTHLAKKVYIVDDDHKSIMVDTTPDYYNTSKDTKILSLIDCDRASAMEIVRHRPQSVQMESQRYVRFNEANPYSICLGSYFEKIDNLDMDKFKQQIINQFDYYTELLNYMKPEDARVVLPNCASTKLFIYATKEEYRHIFNLRQSKYAWKPVKQLMDMLYFKFINQGITL